MGASKLSSSMHARCDSVFGTFEAFRARPYRSRPLALTPPARQSQFSFRHNLFVSVMLIAMPSGSALGGVEDVILGPGGGQGSALFALSPEARRRGFLRPEREVLAIPYLASITVGAGRGVPRL